MKNNISVIGFSGYYEFKHFSQYLMTELAFTCFFSQQKEIIFLDSKSIFFIFFPLLSSKQINSIKNIFVHTIPIKKKSPI